MTAKPQLIDAQRLETRLQRELIDAQQLETGVKRELISPRPHVMSVKAMEIVCQARR